MIDTYLLLKLLIAFTGSLFFIGLLIRNAHRIGLVDIPNHRSIHQVITPRGAGIGMIGGIMLSDIVLLNDLVFSHIAAFLAIFMVFAVGILDDHRDTSPRTKFFVIFAGVGLMWTDGIAITTLGNYFGYEAALGWAALPFTMFAVAGFTNALNLSDGLDGLAGSLSIVILAALALIGYQHDDAFIVTMALSFIAAIAAFLVFNWNPAKIFMGDSGSLTLGFVISLLAIKALDYIEPASILLLAAIPILDTVVVMIRRKRSGKSMFSPDKLHLHHILLNFFSGNVRRTVAFIAILQAFYSLVGEALSGYHYQRYVLVFFALNVALLYLLLNAMIEQRSLIPKRSLNLLRRRKRR